MERSQSHSDGGWYSNPNRPTTNQLVTTLLYCSQVMAHWIVHYSLQLSNPVCLHSLKCLLTYAHCKIYSCLTFKWRLIEGSIWQYGKNKVAFKP